MRRINELNKYLYLIIISTLIAIIYIALTDGGVHHYDNGEISFDYPGNLHIISNSNPSKVVVLSNPESGLNVTVNKQSIPLGYSAPANFVFNTETDNSEYKLLSKQVFNLNGRTAYENTYQVNLNDSLILRKEVWLENNGTLYSIICTFKEASFNPVLFNLFRGETNYSVSDYNDKSPFYGSINTEDFNVLVNSFRINTPSASTTTVIWASVIIPSIKVSWNIRSDTVNEYNSVYHYNESYYPEQNGTCGLLGHHTIYSAPFAEIDQLKTGDSVVIDDYLTQREYIYQVYSNGDLKWDYETNPIEFPPDNKDLLLVTCYPPGTTEAAWLVHCKLITVKPL